MEENTKELKITTLEDLQSYAQGTVVRFPDFAEGQPFVAKVRRPSMLVLAKEGKIPNTLLNTATQLFTKGGGGIDSENENVLKEMYDVCMLMSKATLIAPTLDDIHNAGLTLSDNQIMAIFNYAQTGATALNSFR